MDGRKNEHIRTVGRAIVLVLSTLSDNALYLYQVLPNIS